MHTEFGRSIREIARQQSCHPSTVLRQIRKLETQRDDPLMDEAMNRLSALYDPLPGTVSRKEPLVETVNQTGEPLPDQSALVREGQRILPRLCETGAVLAVGTDMDKAVVVREVGAGTVRTAVVARNLARAMVLKGWITCDSPGRISRYRITAQGRSALRRMIAETENRATNRGAGFAETRAGFDRDGCECAGAQAPAARFSSADSPLAALARRRDRDGQAFLGESLVAAGERLREDFELAQMGPAEAPSWQRFLSGQDRGGYVTDPGVSGPPAMARERVVQALHELGEGLADVALRCCCFLEGLERAEKRLGWSARSGKIVLRIALIRLSEYYRSQAGDVGRMIG
ncbi:DUF6456 domain-containing protein [Shimia sp.]|uniref:DUF6456 domain-containing protein n=1 Tax=Shimia sp. TaxID=1954381 RepID=UPI00356408C4